ncbi:MAG: phosphodiester glycosidase family protein [Anaerolineales bacterium]
MLLHLFTLSFPQFVQASLALPDGFKLIRSSVGVQLYRKEYPGGYPDYVQVIRLDRGAEVRLLHGKVNHQGVTSGVYGGLDVRFTSRSVLKYWDEIISQTSRAFCVTNGQFFYMYEYPTRLPFPLKVNGKVVSGGYSKGEFTDQKLMLEIWKEHADIRPLTKVDFQKSTAPNIVGGLTEDARKSPQKYVGRTFIGVADQNRDGVYETLLIFSAQAARQRDAAEILRNFGAEKVMMLDGGLSTQLVCQGKAYIQTERLIPQAIAVLDGTKPYLKHMQPKPIPPQPQHEMNQIPSQGEQVALSAGGVQFLEAEEQSDRDQPLPTETVVEKPIARVHMSDVLLIPIPILFFSLFLVAILRRVWTHS